MEHLIIPTLGRIHKQKTYNNLPDKWKAKVKFTVQPHEVDEMRDIYGDKVFSNSTSSDALIADYTFRALETDFPSYFTLALEFSLGAAFALSIARDESLASILETKAANLLQQAKTLDSQQQTTRKLVTSRFITERRS